MTKILIVDDEGNNLYLLQALLTSTGYDLETAKNGAEGLNLALNAKPDVIISDILMPVMDGFSFCRACKKDERLRDIPFIFYTATYTDEKDEALALSLGAERFIVKPTEPAIFLSILKNTIAKYATGEKAVHHEVIEDDAYFQEYNTALIRKLEEKVKELEENSRKLEANIDARKRTEERLRESEEQFKHAFEYAPIGKALVHPDGHFLKVNRTYAEILGYSEKELEKMSYQGITHPDDLPVQLDYNRQILEGKIHRYQLEKRYLCKDKRVIWALVNMSLVRDKQGQPLYFISQVQDITESKRLLDELHYSLTLLNLTGKVARVGGWEYDLRTQSLIGTEQMQQIFEVEPNERLHLNEVVNFFPTESQPTIKKAFLAAIESGTPWQLELPFITKKGREIWVSVQGDAECKEGHPVRLYGAFQDITERKLAEKRIQDQTARAEALVRTSTSINSKLAIEDVLATVCSETARALRTEVVILNGYDSERQTISIMADHGLSPRIRRQCFQTPIRDFPPEMKLFSDSPVVLHHVKAISGLPNGELFDSLGLCTYVAVNIKDKDELMGSLAVLSTDPKREFSEDDVVLLQGLANQAAQAITNARLFENTQRQLRNIASLHTIDSAIANGIDIHNTLVVIIEETIKQMEVDAADILLFREASNRLESSVSQGFRTNAMRNVALRFGKGLAGKIAADHQRIYISNLEEYYTSQQMDSLFPGEEFVSYCGVPLRVKGELIGVLEVFNRSRLLPDQDWFNFLETLAGQAAIAIDSIRSFEEIQASNTKLILAYDKTIEGWSRAMDLRDNETEGHTQRVTQMTIRLARMLGISEDQIIHIRRGALLHDMGKLGIPDLILHKPAKLTDEEWVIMRKHPQYAFEMLSSINYLHPALDIPYCHHEKWDGTGYPRGLRGEDIPLSARVFAVVDVWDALISDRPYRKAWSREQALEYIQTQAGIHFDPKVAEVFLASMGYR